MGNAASRYRLWLQNAQSIASLGASAATVAANTSPANFTSNMGAF